MEYVVSVYRSHSWSSDDHQPHLCGRLSFHDVHEALSISKLLSSERRTNAVVSVRVAIDGHGRTALVPLDTINAVASQLGSLLTAAE